MPSSGAGLASASSTTACGRSPTPRLSSIARHRARTSGFPIRIGVHAAQSRFRPRLCERARDRGPASSGQRGVRSWTHMQSRTPWSGFVPGSCAPAQPEARTVECPRRRLSIDVRRGRMADSKHCQTRWTTPYVADETRPRRCDDRRSRFRGGYLFQPADASGTTYRPTRCTRRTACASLVFGRGRKVKMKRGLKES